MNVFLDFSLVFSKNVNPNKTLFPFLNPDIDFGGEGKD